MKRHDMKPNPIKRFLSRPLFFLIGLLCILFTAGCYTTFQQPLTPLNQAVIDDQLIGTWIFQEKEDTGFIHIGIDGNTVNSKGEKTGSLSLVMIGLEDDKELDYSRWSGHVSSLATGSYMNIRQVEPQTDKHPGYIILKYRIVENALELVLIDDDVITKAIKDGKLSGEDKGLDGTYITQDAQTVEKFFLENDPVLFTKDHVLIKGLKKFSSPQSDSEQ